VAQGEALFSGNSCSACHGPAGGGGLCPPVTNDIWVYGGDDDTLFRLIALGSDGLQGQGYSRKGHESAVAPMPPFGSTLKSSDDLWKILAFIRAHYQGDPSRKFGVSASQQ
jgi:mono/diheme cytochrome c family protein